MYDIIIIGAGSAGISAYTAAKKQTDHLLIINDGPWDTTCARVGCMPSKVLIASANQYHDAKNLSLVGIDAKVTADLSGVLPRVREYRDRFTQGMQKTVDSWKAEHKINGKARFINSNTVEVNGKQYQAKAFIIAVGSTPRPNDEWQKAVGDRLLTTDTLFELKTLPNSIAVVGSGTISTELALALHHLDVKTTIFARGKHIASATSPRIQELVIKALQPKLNVLFETSPDSLTLKDNQVEVNFTYQDQKQKIAVDYVLNATGRVSHLDGLGLDQIDPTYSDLKQLPIDEYTKQLAKHPIFIVGDAHTTTPVQHEASYEGKIAVKNVFNFPNVTEGKDLPPLSVVFSSPEIAIVGQSYKQLKDKQIDFETGFASYENQGRATVLGKNIGGIEVYIEKDTQIFLGAEIFVTEGEHLAHLLAWILKQKPTIQDILSQPFYHPTLEEGVRTAFRDAKYKLKSK
ncbi:dihydrolipoyl dehydrogenase [Acinetobacter sp. B5B]|uniref:dihydrolipoyl dehydrogenase n=1 Tax=Acinetobacter baretiae TaxID=2605383 RepID=UPI0018C2375E|nr:dihydrolipoyl dehydrogenase [Acinetobacter baretiae]MBF7683806.1 dihydrolipoyl dehydrogenase [Acinetobacter baretiae]